MPKKNSQPKTKEIEFEEELHGTKISDPYRWLEQDGEETQQWIKKQNAYTRSILDNIPIRENIKDRLSQLFQLGTIGIPVPRKGRYFFRERKGNEDLSVLYVQDGLNGAPRVLVNPNTLSQDKTTVLSGWYPSRDGKLLAYALSETGNDQANIRILNVNTGKDLPDVIPSELYPGFNTWDYENKGFYYTRRHPDAPKGEEKFHKKIYYHKLEDNPNDDRMIFGKNLAKGDWPSIGIYNKGRYLLISVRKAEGEQKRDEIYLCDAHNPRQRFIPIFKNINALFSACIYKDKLYVLTNLCAPHWELISTYIRYFTEGGIGPSWKTIIPESEHMLEYFKIMNNSIFVETLENVCSVFRRYKLDGTLVSEIPLPTLGSLGAITGERDGNELFFRFSSFLIPSTIYRLDLKTEKIQVFKKLDAGINTNQYQAKQVWYNSKNKTRIPIFLVHKKNIQRTGNNPVVLYGYGGFNISETPGFRKTIIPFLEHGGIYAVANIRGGGEFGEEWHRAGMKENKQNVFDDFIAAAEWLIEKQYTNPKRLALSGGSNGGLLVGAVITQRPDICKFAHLGAPVLDMLRYHKFFGGAYWIQDYGDPDNPRDFKYLLAYSPYHNVKDKTYYPAVLLNTADSDDRVHPMHAYKMAAKLQKANASKNSILLRAETKAGHGGAAPIYRIVEEQADIWALTFWQLSIKE